MLSTKTHSYRHKKEGGSQWLPPFLIAFAVAARTDDTNGARIEVRLDYEAPMVSGDYVDIGMRF